jgi:hypothetical protein
MVSVWLWFGVSLALCGVRVNQLALRDFNGLHCFETWHGTCFIHSHQRRTGQTVAERLARRLLVSILRSSTVNSEVFMMTIFGMIVAGYLIVSLIDEMI